VKKFFGLLLFIALLTASILGYQYYQKIFAPNVPAKLRTAYLLIPSNTDFQGVVDSLHFNKFIKDTTSFRQLAVRMNYKQDNMRAGRFEIKPNWSNYELIKHLRGGEQASVKVVLNVERTTENVAAKVARFIESDSLSLVTLMQDEAYLQEIGFSVETLMSLFIPNTYEFYWNTAPKQFMEKMLKEHKRFWEKENRLGKAKKLNLTPAEVYTLASIVEKETLRKEEKNRMAGVYLNRLKIGMRLQADPTAVFATRDFDTKRVTNYHIGFDSPYNTYLYAGLPPGPIHIASISSIDGVLNAEQHDYYYFCARGDESGLHNFARTLEQHNANVKTYVANLRKRGKR